MMTSVWRLAHGQPLYGKPSLEWAPFLYAPLFFYASLAMSKITGLGYVALRSVSLLSALGTAAVLYLHIRRETANTVAAISAVGIYASLYSVALGWYDIGRVDSLSVFLFVLAVYCMRFAPPPIAAIVWVLAFQTKQGFLPIGLLAFVVEWRRPRRMVLNMAIYAALAWLSIVWLQRTSGGWYSYYVFGTVKQLGISRHYAVLYLPYDLLQPLPIALLLCAMALMVRPIRWSSQRGFFYVWFTLLITGSIWFARAHEGSYVNTILPAYVWLVLVAGIAIARLAPLDAQSPLPGLLWLMVIAQISMHLYRPIEFDPSPSMLATREHFLDIVRGVPGDIWLTSHSYDAILAGKPLHAEMDALDAVLEKDPQVAAEVREAIAGKHFTAILLDHEPETYSPAWLFNGPPFTSGYRQEAIAPMNFVNTVGDQPSLAFLPCDIPATAAQSLLMPQTFARQGQCPSGAQ
ncbi:hypothetical protein [Bryocella elongata]|nr:hypothetical protein [Bryocella elongata]